MVRAELTSAVIDPDSITANIGTQIASNGRGAQRSERVRILVQLGIGLALAYVLFLSLWFWMTRGRLARRRVVRF
jgi:hypothetical protein